VAIQCPEPDALPLPPAEVTVTVLNGTTRSGLAEEDAAAGALEQPVPVPEGC
jgi:hypothetical protein